MGYFTRTRKIICENSYGYKLEFGYSFPYFLSEYSGIHEYDGDVATVKSAFGIGVTYVGTSVNSRNISLTIAFKDNSLAQTRKNQLYNIFPLKDYGTLYYYEGDIARKIHYYVESLTITRSANILYASISLICPSPYFLDSEETIAVLQNWDKLLAFPLEILEDGIEFGKRNDSTAIEIENNTHIDYGLTITFLANATVINPGLKNTWNNEEMKLNYNLNTNEKIVVSTYNNEKSITFVDSNNNETDITNSLVFGTKFLQAGNGINKFVSSADSGVENLEVSIAYSNYYEAI